MAIRPGHPGHEVAASGRAALDVVDGENPVGGAAQRGIIDLVDLAAQDRPAQQQRQQPGKDNPRAEAQGKVAAQAAGAAHRDSIGDAIH
ncbi:hypothetical protein D3C76_1441370 [compost metagenome]